MTESQRTGRIRPLLSGVVLRAQTDERLGALASGGNGQAFSVIYERYRRELRAHAGRIVRADRTDDVVQQAMLSAWTALLADAEVVDLRAWLHRIVHNAALSTTARRGYDDTAIPDSRAAPKLTEDLAERRLTAAEAIAAIAALPASQRRALTLTAIDGHSGRDTALAMGISESAVRQLIHRARSGVRSAVSAIIPLPLVTWLLGGGAATATPVAVGLGAAGGAALTTAKVIAVLGVAGATFGATHVLQTHHHHHATPPRHGPTQLVTTAGPGTTRAVDAPSGAIAERLHEVGGATGSQISAGQSGSDIAEGAAGGAAVGGSDGGSSRLGADTAGQSADDNAGRRQAERARHHEQSPATSSSEQSPTTSSSEQSQTTPSKTTPSSEPNQP